MLKQGTQCALNWCYKLHMPSWFSRELPCRCIAAASGASAAAALAAALLPSACSGLGSRAAAAAPASLAAAVTAAAAAAPPCLELPAVSKVVRSRLALGGLGSEEPASPGSGLPRLPAEAGPVLPPPTARLPPPLTSGRSRRLPAPPLRTVLWPALGPAGAPPAVAATAGERRKEAMLRCLVVRRVLGAGLLSRSPAGTGAQGGQKVLSGGVEQAGSSRLPTVS